MSSIERRSGIDSRSESEKQSFGERRSSTERRSRLPSTGLMPSNDQLVLFARRLKRAMRDEKSRGFFGVASGEDHFTYYSDVVRLIDWIEHTAGSEAELGTASAKPTLRKAAIT
ncbi:MULTISPECIES: hypothetical protein [Bradyrhizobium]|uniref:hypothetical protein n=1 Tax=Bradyrhizobium TaxID=374 RepID=UPI00115FC64A|nr:MULTISPECIES: hypothetical protein [Bradyrhizobium]